MKIGIITKTNRADFEERLKQVVERLEGKGCQVFADRETVEHYRLPKTLSSDAEAIPDLADVIIVFGGDGTLLRVARLIQGRNAPILGVNLGSLGFLTEVTLEDLDPALERLVKGDYIVDNRRMLKLQTCHRDGQTATYHALNDMVINQGGALARIISMETYIDDDFVSDFLADGLIVSTPTGSTAYSLSAGGPILYPTLDSVVLTPVCPHTLTNRPLVVPSQSRIRILVKSGDNVVLTVDGQVGTDLQVGDEILCSCSDQQIQLIRAGHRDFFDVLREKLKWGER